ncbi:hypothetical protein PHISP_04544 [Aspergillus sp. HF37]|nr:hypothetical protein PHISP_04544 [Aspergillus sp. HF37]
MATGYSLLDRMSHMKMCPLSPSSFPNCPPNEEQSKYTKRDTNSCANRCILGVTTGRGGRAGAIGRAGAVGRAGVVGRGRRRSVGFFHESREGGDIGDYEAIRNGEAELRPAINVTAVLFAKFLVDEDGVAAIG